MPTIPCYLAPPARGFFDSCKQTFISRSAKGMAAACRRASHFVFTNEPFQRSSSRRRRSRFGLDNASRRTAAILLGFIKQFDLALQQLIFEFFPVQIQLDFAVEARLAD